MKQISTIHAIFLIVITLNLSASARPPASSEVRQAREELLGLPAELGPARDAFEAFRRLTFEGDEFYSKNDKEVHGLHRRAYQDITHAVTGDRISFEQARIFVDRLIAIGDEHVAGEEDPDDVAIPTIGKLEQLVSDVDDAMTEYANPDAISPEIDRLYWLMEEVARFAEASDLSSSKTSRLNRELDKLLDDETGAKSDEVLTESERLDLLQDSLRTWAGFIYTFRKN